MACASARGDIQLSLESRPALYAMPAYSVPYSFSDVVGLSIEAPRRLSAAGAPAPESDPLGVPARPDAAATLLPEPAAKTELRQPQARPGALATPGAGGPVLARSLPDPARWLMTLSGLAIIAFIALRRSGGVER